jgi:hypothetical protein
MQSGFNTKAPWRMAPRMTINRKKSRIVFAPDLACCTVRARARGFMETPNVQNTPKAAILRGLAIDDRKNKIQ